MGRRTTIITVCGMVVVAVMLVLAQGGCSKAENPWDKVKGGNLKVLVSFPPLYCFTKAVAGDDAKVETMLAEIGPHEHRPAASDAYLAAGADLFLANGLTLDDFVTKVADNTRNRKIKVIMVAEMALPRDKLLRHHHHDEEEHDDPGHKHGEWDPHAWLGIDQAVLMVNSIRDTLKEADPAHAAGYDTRAAAYVQKLLTLHADGKKLLEGKKNRKLIAMHESLGYFCKSFQLDLVDSVMPRPGVEADLPKLTQLVNVCKDNNVKVLAIEPQYKQSKAAEILRDSLLRQKDHTLHLVEIDPLETCTRQELNEDYYFKVMRRNLDNLAKHME